MAELKRLFACRNGASLPLAAALCVISIGWLVLFGWAIGSEPLKRVNPSFVAMNPLTAGCFVLAGVALALKQIGLGRSAAVAGALVGLLAAAKLVDLPTGAVPVDRIMFSEFLYEGPHSPPNRMAPNTALAFLLVGVALSLSTSGRQKLQLFSQMVAVGALLISMFALVGYAFSMSHLTGIGLFIPMALHTGGALLLLSAGIVSSLPHVGLMLVLRDRGPAGTMARTVLPLAVGTSVAVGAIRLWGQHRGYYGTEAGEALQVTANVMVTSALLITSIFALFRSDVVRRQHEQALKKSEHLNRTINQASPDCVSLLDGQGNVLFVNDATLRAYDLASDYQLIGRLWGYQLEPGFWRDRDAALTAARGGEVGRLTLWVRSQAGDLRWFESLVSRLAEFEDHPHCFIVMSRDITRQKQVEDQVRWTASHDALTGLPNRSLFQARLDEITGDRKAGFAILLLDVDDFKQVNDTLGHDAGDALLVTVGQRLRNALRPEDFVARLAGDEFAILLDGVRTEAGAVAAAEKLVERLREPWIYGGRVGDCRTSIGISVARKRDDNPTDLLKNADIALYAAKSEQRGGVAVFQPHMRAAMQKRSSKLSLARYAVQEGLIFPFYQPKVELESGRVVGLEALLRWRHPASGIQAPESIDAAFEDLELAQQLTDRILSQVIADMRGWLDAGIHFGHVAVNAAAADFKQNNFAELLLERLQTNSIPPSCFQLEVTETVFLGRGAEYVERALKTLSDSGVRIALDDFGTGYASLSHLKQFPVDVVKIDRSFLREVEQDAHNAAIIRTVVSLGSSLNLEVVAEGVETAEQAKHLMELGCKIAQGYLFGKAMPAAHVPKLVGSASGIAQAA